MDGLTYERSLFSPETGNWRDLRAPDGQAQFMTAWCHGAPGIGLARLRGLPFLDTPAVRAEIDACIAATLAHTLVENHSLCHGALGNLEILFEAATALGRPGLAQQAAHLRDRIVTGIARDGWVCGVPLGIETPGLIVGLAGIGYGLLRLAAPERVPSILALDPPITRGSTKTAITLHPGSLASPD